MSYSFTTELVITSQLMCPDFREYLPVVLCVSGIYGVWFYDKEECKRVGNKLNR